MFPILSFCVCMIFWSASASNNSYISLSGQLSGKSQIAILSNNLANKSTKGFISDLPNLGVAKTRNKNLSFVKIVDTSLDNADCALIKTDKELDIAIKGKGYFKLLVHGKERYSLKGAMRISPERVLVNPDGHPFLDKEGSEILIPEDALKISVSSTGAISCFNGIENDVVGQVGVFDAALSSPARKDHLGYIVIKQSVLVKESHILQGYLASSNVDSKKIMNEIASIQNAIDLNTKLLSKSFQMDRSAIEILQTNK